MTISICLTSSGLGQETDHGESLKKGLHTHRSPKRLQGLFFFEVLEVIKSRNKKMIN